VEFFKSPKELVLEKRALVESLQHGGVAILNGDDEDAALLAAAAPGRVIRYGMLPAGADVLGSDDEVLYERRGRRKVPLGISFKVTCGGVMVPVSLHGVLGRQHIYPVLAAFAVGVAEEYNLVRLAETFRLHETPPGRMRLLSGVKDTTIIDDSYNASPVAVAEALATLGRIDGSGRRIAVLGDMMELGKYSKEAHRLAGEEAAGVCNELLTVGVRARDIAEGALQAGMGEAAVFQFDNAAEAGKFLERLLREGDVVLIKGSQAVRMECIVEEIMAEPERAEELLVRQEANWKRRV
jgi:UDP-N-acetylmuramoyl-tripeptide--D-alanyl-D-alanine ligase